MWAQSVEGWVIPAEVGPGGASGERNIHTVIDQDRNRQGVYQRAGQLQNLGRHAIFPADLNHRRAALHRGATDRDRIPPLEENGIGDHHQAQLIGKRHDQDPARPAWSDHGDRQYE